MTEFAGSALRELIDESIRGFERCSASAHGSDENLGVLFPFLHLVELLDAAQVLLASSVVDPAFVVLRSAFEGYLTVLYVCETDTTRRGSAWVVSEIHRRLRGLERLDPASQRGKQFRAALKNDPDARDIHIPLLENLEEEREGYLELLKAPHLRFAATEFVRTQQALKKIPKFHALWGGPGDTEQLARHLQRSAQYEVLYRPWSSIAHGENLRRQLKSSQGGAVIAVLRNPSEIRTAYFYAMTFAISALNAMLAYYRPEEIGSTARRGWYESRIRSAYLAVAE
jgi:hypothetical protein